MNKSILLFLFVALFTLHTLAVNGQVDDDFWEKSDENASPYQMPNSIDLYSPNLIEKYNFTLEQLRNYYKITEVSIVLMEDQLETTSDASSSKELKKSLKQLTDLKTKLGNEIFEVQSAYSDRMQPEELSKKLNKAQKKFPDAFPDNQQLVSDPIPVNSTFSYDDFFKQNPNLSEREIQIPNPCITVFNGQDPNTLKNRVELKSEEFFYYTHPNLQGYYGSQSFLKGFASVIIIDSDYFLLLNIRIKSKDAIQNYGYIAFESKMRMTMMDGENIYLESATESRGTYDDIKGETNYFIYYPMDKWNKTYLKKYEIDEVGIMWTSGFEKYEIFNVDVLQRQLECLEKK